MGYLLEEGLDGSISWRKDTGCKNKRANKKKYKRIQKMKKTSKRINRK